MRLRHGGQLASIAREEGPSVAAPARKAIQHGHAKVPVGTWTRKELREVSTKGDGAILEIEQPDADLRGRVRPLCRIGADPGTIARPRRGIPWILLARRLDRAAPPVAAGAAAVEAGGGLEQSELVELRTRPAVLLRSVRRVAEIAPGLVLDEGEQNRPRDLSTDALAPLLHQLLDRGPRHAGHFASRDLQRVGDHTVANPGGHRRHCRRQPGRGERWSHDVAKDRQPFRLQRGLTGADPASLQLLMP